MTVISNCFEFGANLFIYLKNTLSFVENMQENTNIESPQNQFPNSIPIELIRFLETAIQKNMAHDDMLHYLSENQYSKSIILEATGLVESDLEEKKHATSGTRSVGFAWIVAGLAILMLPINHGQHQVAYIISYSILLFGCLRWAHGWIRNSQFKKQLQFIENWKLFLETKMITELSEPSIPPDESSGYYQSTTAYF